MHLERLKLCRNSSVDERYSSLQRRRKPSRKKVLLSYRNPRWPVLFLLYLVLYVRARVEWLSFTVKKWVHAYPWSVSVVCWCVGRPCMQLRKVVSWLSMHNFPYGVVSFADGISTDPLRHKTEYLRGRPVFLVILIGIFIYWIRIRAFWWIRIRIQIQDCWWQKCWT